MALLMNCCCDVEQLMMCHLEIPKEGDFITPNFILDYKSIFSIGMIKIQNLSVLGLSPLFITFVPYF